MESQPILNTERLRLRPFLPDDVPAISMYLNDREIHETTARIPWPYSEKDAVSWIDTHEELLKTDKEIAYAIVLKENNSLVGSISLRLDLDNEVGDMGYWVGKPHWGKGYATEAAARLLQYGFEELKLNRIQAHYMIKNPASGRVLSKIGMSREGRIRQYIKKNDDYEDVEMYSILRTEYEDRLVK